MKRRCKTRLAALFVEPWGDATAVLEGVASDAPGRLLNDIRLRFKAAEDAEGLTIGDLYWLEIKRCKN